MPVKDIEAPGFKIQGSDLHELRRTVAELLDRTNNHNFPGAQPVSFARRHLEELKHQDYYVCEKTDGLRYLLYLTTDPKGLEAQILINRKNEYWMVPRNGLHFPISADIQKWHNGTLIDGELVMDILPNGEKEAKFLVFDCIVLDSRSLMNRSLDKRLGHFRDAVIRPYDALYKQYPEEKQHLHFLVELKVMQFSYAVEMMFRQVLPELPHGNDGLIFTCRTTDYKFGTDPHILKWKPEGENSIDFTLRLDFPFRQPDQEDMEDGFTKPYVDYNAVPTCNLHVYAGDNKEDPWYATMYVEDHEWEDLKQLNEPLDDRIVECFMDDQKRWRYMRFRDDKRTANHTSTVESVIESIMDRVTDYDLIGEAKEIRSRWKERAAKNAALAKEQETKRAEAAREQDTKRAEVAAGAAGMKRKAQEDLVSGR